MEPRIVIPINKEWRFRQADKKDSEFLPVAQFPTQVHLDLLHHGIIPDPNIGKNELDVQWIGEAVWVYKTTFRAPDVASPARAVLAFDGLDTFATVVLNGKQVLETDNMFTPERVDITDSLNKDAENDLEITFDSAYLRGWKLVEKYPDHKWGCWNGDNSRLAVRKSQYHWIYESRLSDLWCDIEVDKSLKSATVKANTSVEGKAGKIRFDVSLDGQSVAGQEVDGTNATFLIKEPALWYPARYGKQPLYTVKASLLDGNKVVDSITKTVGLRRSELVQRPLKDQPGTSFFFEVNGIPVFCGGSNWIPADNFIPRISKERYRDWVKIVAEGNQCMIRVWGGGIYEEQAFYDACDELGILVWQDFMFGCGNYPAWPELLASIKREAEENVKRLRHHPSIVIFAGNNEDYSYAESVNLTWDKDNHDADSWLKTDFPARYIYEKILPEACKALVPGTHYHPGSPWGGVSTSDATIGDIHQWNVWHGSQEKYQNFDKLVGRFVSEFGMEAFPSIKTIDGFLPRGKDDPDRYAQSSTMDFHNKAEGHERRLALYLVENMRYGPDPLEQFVYSTQLMQGECLASAYRLWKRQWRGPGREYCAGALVWQINDCWPVTSWAICDYHLRPKHAYYTVKREMAPVSVGMTRREHRRPRGKHSRVDVDVRTEIEIWGSNLTLDDLTADCVVHAWDVETGEPIQGAAHVVVAPAVALPANRSTEITALDVPGDTTEAARTVVAAYLVRDGRQLARYVNWPEPLKYLHLQRPQKLVAQLSDDCCSVAVSAEVPVKGLALECDDDGVRFEDNLVDIVPGETVTIGVRGATSSTVITTRYLGMI